MRIKLRTTMAHPKFGVVSPGQIVDFPAEDAQRLVDSFEAELVTPEIETQSRQGSVPLQSDEHALCERLMGTRLDEDGWQKCE